MKITLTIKKEFDVKTLYVQAGARYWEDAKVNDAEDSVRACSNQAAGTNNNLKKTKWKQEL